MTNDEFEPLRIRIMKEAYDLADRNDTEGFNAVKAMCSDVQKLIESPDAWQVRIVKECARFADEYVSEGFGVHYSVGDELKKHFGIKE